MARIITAYELDRLEKRLRRMVGDPGKHFSMLTGNSKKKNIFARVRAIVNHPRLSKINYVLF